MSECALHWSFYVQWYRFWCFCCSSAVPVTIIGDRSNATSGGVVFSLLRANRNCPQKFKNASSNTFFFACTKYIIVRILLDIPHTSIPQYLVSKNSQCNSQLTPRLFSLHCQVVAVFVGNSSHTSRENKNQSRYSYSLVRRRAKGKETNT